MSTNEKAEFEAKLKSQRIAFTGFMQNVVSFFSDANESLSGVSGRNVVHSIKYREKDIDHLMRKIERKNSTGRTITPENLFSEVTDLIGVRVLHLRPMEFPVIHKSILEHVKSGHWDLFEDPKAYTWDPEYKEFFVTNGVKTELKESFYTSVHYVVRPNRESYVCCEIQVRSLFEEIWGEIDHQLNYPDPTSVKSCQEQLRVLSKLVGAGSRLVDSIVNTIEFEEIKLKKPERGTGIIKRREIKL
jgi:putative GTP pyrophosphokinase